MATLFRRPPPQKGQAVYTIDIPGAVDLFHFIIPALNDKELKKQRILRMLTKKSPVPESLQWIPDVINKIDDAQDLLVTALWLAKPLIRKLPTRWIPFVGWALLVSDIANLSTLILSLAMTPGLTKPDLHKNFKKCRFGKKDLSLKVTDFLKPGGWRQKVGYYLQAAQAAETLTGVGLTLGAVMGCLSDMMWAPYQLAKGNRVEIRLPPEADPANKAYRFLFQTPKQFFMHDILNDEDHALVLAAQNMALTIALSNPLPINDERINSLMDARCPVMIPWEQSSREALEEEGFDLSKENYYKPYVPIENPTFGETLDMCNTSIPEYNAALKTEIGSGDEGTIFWLIGQESGIDAISYVTGWNEDDILEYSIQQMSALKLSEYNFKLTASYGPSSWPAWLDMAIGIANSLGRKYPTINDFIGATNMRQWKWAPKY